MIRAIRRWWAWMRHRHDWVVIERYRVVVISNLTGKKHRDNAILERCTCGAERARQWDGNRWQTLDLEWVNDQIVRNGWEIPARHQE